MKERQRRILDRVEEKGKVSISELARLSGVSGVTIRKDLAELESLHYLSRAHGYACRLTTSANASAATSPPKRRWQNGR